ncbi:MAG: porin, partial [Rhizobiales bacterium]|nr:porin [Hyphomicrobiales bacterium]
MRVLSGRLLLGSAASLAMMSVASAADLPMAAKAPAVQYVKICTLYGAGFYYIPGTDTCLKIGGYIRTQVESNSAGGGIAVGSNNSSQGRQTRTDTNDIQYRNRAVVTFDARTQGEYGTLRSYYVVGWEATTPTGTAAGTTANAYWDRAFIQFAGFTVGKAQSFFDIYTFGGSRSYLNVRTSGDTGASGLMLWAYTAQFGGGFSATLSLEDPRGHNLAGVIDINSGATLENFFTGAASRDNGLANNLGTGFQVPDIVGNLRYDQRWGFIGVSAALHQVAGGYYTAAAGCAFANTTACGHPEDEWGYALGIGAQLNVPGMPGDTVGAMFRYSKGAVGYSISAGAGGWLLVSGNTVGVAGAYDAIFGNPSNPGGGKLHLTEAWSANAHYEHVWTPTLKT